MKRLLLIVMALTGCELERHEPATVEGIRRLCYRDDVATGVRCYDWCFGESAISCLMVLPVSDGGR